MTRHYRHEHVLTCVRLCLDVCISDVPATTSVFYTLSSYSNDIKFAISRIGRRVSAGRVLYTTVVGGHELDLQTVFIPSIRRRLSQRPSCVPRSYGLQTHRRRVRTIRRTRHDDHHTRSRLSVVSCDVVAGTLPHSSCETVV